MSNVLIDFCAAFASPRPSGRPGSHPVWLLPGAGPSRASRCRPAGPSSRFSHTRLARSGASRLSSDSLRSRYPARSVAPEKGRVTRERPAARIACGIFPGTPQEKGPTCCGRLVSPVPHAPGARVVGRPPGLRDGTPEHVPGLRSPPTGASAARPFGPERTVLVRSTSSGSVRACSPYARRRVAVWAALPLGPERAAPRGRHCHSALSAPSWYARRRVAVWAALPLGPERAVPCGWHCHSALSVPFWYARRRVAV